MAITLNDATKATEELAAVAAALSRSIVQQVRSRIWCRIVIGTLAA